MIEQWLFAVGNIINNVITLLDTNYLTDGVSFLGFIIATTIISMVVTTLLYKGRT